MGSVSRESRTIIKEKTKDGEITINLVLTIKLDGDNLSVTADKPKNKPILNMHQKNDENVNFEIPEFDSGEDLIDFGKDV